MKVARIHQHGGPEVLVYEDVPEPGIRANQVLIRVRACALNHLDLFVRAGIPGMKFSMPHILGSDIAGKSSRWANSANASSRAGACCSRPGVSCRQCEQCLSGQGQFLPQVHQPRIRGGWRQCRAAGRARVQRDSDPR